MLSRFWSDFLIAWLFTKTTEPVRLIVTLTLLPVLARRLPLSVLRFFKLDDVSKQAAGMKVRPARAPAADAKQKKRE